MSAAATIAARRVLVVGDGMVGGRLVEEVLARRGRPGTTPVAVTLVGEEPYGSYNRVLLSDVVAGRADVAGLALGDADALREAGVEVLRGTAVTSLDPGTGTALLSCGRALAFDEAVLATGAAPVVPALAGLDPDGPLPPGVYAFRTLDDCREIVAAAGNARRAAVLGGGLLGLETARGLARRGLAVTLVHGAPFLLQRQVDAVAGQVLARAVRRLGVDVVTSAAAEALETDAEGRLSGLRLVGGQVLDADLLVLSCGVLPRTGLARDAGIAVERGIVVDDELRTSHPRVRALGDCAQHDGDVPGLVAPGWDQARILADLLTGAEPSARYRGWRPAARLKAADVEVTAVGQTQVDPFADDGSEVVQLLDPAGARYVKAVVRDDTVVGGIAVGDARAGAELALLVERGAAAPTDRTLLLLPGTRRTTEVTDDPTLIPDRATVCRCNGVTKGAIVSAWTAGARTLDAVRTRTRAATGCGGCRDAVAGIVDWLAAADPPAPPPTPAGTTGTRAEGLQPPDADAAAAAPPVPPAPHAPTLVPGGTR